MFISNELRKKRGKKRTSVTDFCHKNSAALILLDPLLGLGWRAEVSL
jgi:hypothetical protein